MKLLRKQEYPSGKFTLAFVGYGNEADNTVVESIRKCIGSADHFLPA